MIYLRDIRTDSVVHQSCMDVINEDAVLKEAHENGDDIVVGEIVEMKTED